MSTSHSGQRSVMARRMAVLASLLLAAGVGDRDPLRFDARKLHDILDSYGIRNRFTMYPGTHTSAVAYRFQDHVLPFFSRHLCFEHCARRAPADVTAPR